MSTRREMLQISAGAAAGALLVPALAGAKVAQPQPPKPGGHEVKPLPFDAAKAHGLSAAMLTSHHDNNYAAAVKNLNKVELDVQKIDKDTPGYTVAGLRVRELTYTNSKILHEHYFDNLGGDGKVAG